MLCVAIVFATVIAGASAADAPAAALDELRVREQREAFVTAVRSAGTEHLERMRTADADPAARQRICDEGQARLRAMRRNGLGIHEEAELLGAESALAHAVGLAVTPPEAWWRVMELVARLEADRHAAQLTVIRSDAQGDEAQAKRVEAERALAQEREMHGRTRLELAASRENEKALHEKVSAMNEVLETLRARLAAAQPDDGKR